MAESRSAVEKRIALKVDCDIYVGTREGVPRLVDLFARKGIRATFFFTFGPDRSGVAARRFFTTPGFFQKMFRSRGASLYGLRTALSGTLLPAPMIGARCGSQIHEVGKAGHPCLPATAAPSRCWPDTACAPRSVSPACACA